MPSEASRLVPAIEGAEIVPGNGTALLQALEALPEDRRVLGLEGMTVEALFGAEGVCEPLHIQAHAVHEGESYELRYRVEPFTWMTAPRPVLYALPDTCTAALLASGGALRGAVGNGCSTEDEAAHFPAGSGCRDCLTSDGDHARCVAETACRTERTREVAVRIEGSTRYLDMLEGEALGCAPDVLGRIVLLTAELGEDDTPPAPFDHAAIAQICQWAWSESGGESRLYCVGATGPIEPALSDVMVGRVDSIRRAGDSAEPLRDRTMMTSRVELLGHTFAAMPLFPNTLATVSLPDPMIGGWTFHPDSLRPDGTDPADPDHTLARDWIGGVALKTATRIDGVPVSVFNRNLCEPHQWQGPDAEGRFFCKPGFFDEQHQPPDVLRWAYDWGAFYMSISPEIVEILPLVTLAATGHMDPAIPGGHVPHVLGSPVLADPDWEACAWPETFVPDEMANIDSSAQGLYNFTSQTYRFGKDATRDIRVALATNWRREFCFEPLQPAR